MIFCMGDGKFGKKSDVMFIFVLRNIQVGTGTIILTLLMLASCRQPTSPPAQEEDPIHKNLYEKGKKMAQQKPEQALQVLDSALVIARSRHNAAWEYKDRLQQAFCHCNTRRFDRADSIFQALEGITEALDGQPELAAATFQVKGSCAHIKNDLNAALDFYTQGIRHPAALPAQRVAMSLNASRVLGSLQRNNAALQILQSVQRDVEQLNDPALEFLFYFNTAHVYENIHDLTHALEYHFKAFNLSGVAAADRLSAAYQIGTQYSNRNIDSAVYYLRLVTDHKEDARPRTWRLGVSALVGWYNDHQTDSAAIYLKRWEAAGIDSADSDYWVKKGRYLNARGQLKEGIPLIEKALELYRTYENDDSEYGNDILADLVRARVKATAPAQHITDLDALLDSLNHQNNLIVEQEVERFRVQYETEKIERHNQELTREKQWQQWLIVLLALSVLATGAWAVQTRRLAMANARRREMEKAHAAWLEEQNEQLAFSNAELLEKLASNTAASNWADELITLKTDRQKAVLRTGDICYIEAGEGGTYWHTMDGQQVFVWQSLKGSLQYLPSNHFVQISKSAIVARQEIASRTAALVRLRNGIELTLGETYRRALE